MVENTQHTNHPRLPIVQEPTPLQLLPRLSEILDIELYVKRDDLAGPSIGGNKSRQLEYYFGAALSANADTILITGAVQSNFARLAAAVAASQNMHAVVQLEERVKSSGRGYHENGNVLLARMLGADILSYPEGEDETGADAALYTYAEKLRSDGRTPYVIPLGEDHPPIGALGYVDAAHEIMMQASDFEVFVVASGSGATHSGLLTGVRDAGSSAKVIGSCVRRDAGQQRPRIQRTISRLADLHPGAEKVSSEDIIVWDGALAPGYGKAGEHARSAMAEMAQKEGLILDPVYTAKSFAAVTALTGTGEVRPGSKVCFVHTGGLAAVFAYANALV